MIMCLVRLRRDHDLLAQTAQEGKETIFVFKFIHHLFCMHLSRPNLPFTIVRIYLAGCFIAAISKAHIAIL